MLARRIFAVVLISVVGCQTAPRVNRHIELLNAEKRVLEDQLYELEYELEDALEELTRLKAENTMLRRRSGIPSSPKPALRSPPKATHAAPRTQSSSQSPDLAPPQIDEGMLTEPKIELPDEGSAQSLPEPTMLAAEPPIPPDVTRVGENRQAGAILSAPMALDSSDPRVTHIYLNPLLTGGSDFDRQPGDDGLTVAIEPRNREDAFVPLAGPISIVLVDPSLEEDRGRIARWDLDAKNVHQAIQTTGSTRGIQLRLPWPDGAPSNNRVQLFVRYVTMDGRKLDASREIFITLPGQFSQRWTPRAANEPTTGRSSSPLSANNSTAPVAMEVITVPPEPQVQAASHTESDEGGNDSELKPAGAGAPPVPPWHPTR